MQPNKDMRGVFSLERAIFGTSLLLDSTRVAEVIGRSGFDFVMVDTLHGHFDKCKATDAIRALAATKTFPMGRVAHNDPGRINDLLDAGALGLVVPMVNSAKQAEEAVSYTFYPPEGIRSKGSIATILYGDDYATFANEKILLIIMIESPDGVQRAGEILSVAGIDACLIGTSDLMFSMGCSRDDDKFIQSILRVIDFGKKHNVPIGLAVKNELEAGFWLDKGVSFFLVPHDLSILHTAAKSMASSYRDILENKLDVNDSSPILRG
jgi:2-keto-3-deoxy-L-rhamnonate aldolase RhmA